jgi:RHS repeat-associated protein
VPVATSHGYDNIYQLTQTVLNGSLSETYSYDAVGNRLSSLGVSPYLYNESNQLSSTPAAGFSYDANGNTLSKTEGSGTTNYTWDFENRLTSVSLPGGGVVSFQYDSFGRRIYKNSASGTAIYVYDGDNQIEELNSSGGVVARYTQGLGIDEPLALYRSGKKYYYHADGLGSIAAMTDNHGTPKASYTYDAFGNDAPPEPPPPPSSVTNPFRYTGRELDSETGLYYYRARYYDPMTGRFLSEDPIGFDAGINFYGYVRNNPSAFTDPFGLFSVDNRIRLVRALDIDFACPITSGGACTTKLRASVDCTCKCEGSGWKASATLIIAGTMYVSSGLWPYKGRIPRDPSVYDQPSAIAHEYRAHINPAIEGVKYSLNSLEAKTFHSKNECDTECKKTSDFVRALFGAILNDTQQAEARNRR